MGSPNAGNNAELFVRSLPFECTSTKIGLIIDTQSVGLPPLGLFAFSFEFP
jgi:hypothetical protein